MEPARPVGRVFSPLDEELALLPGTLAPRQQGHLVQLLSWMPFRHARRVLEELLGVSVSPETARRLGEAVGKEVEEKQTADAQEPWKEEANAPEHPSRLAISADGAMVPLTGGAWAEVRTLAIGVVPTGPADPRAGACRGALVLLAPDGGCRLHRVGRGGDPSAPAGPGQRGVCGDKREQTGCRPWWTSIAGMRYASSIFRMRLNTSTSSWKP